MHGALDCGRRGSSPWRVGHTLGYFLHREQLASSAASSSHHLGQSDALEVIDCTLRSLRNDSRPFGGVTVVVSGDFCQLPVVKKSHLLWRYATELKLTINTRLLQGRLSQQNIVANYTRRLRRSASAFSDVSSRPRTKRWFLAVTTTAVMLCRTSLTAVMTICRAFPPSRLRHQTRRILSSAGT